MLRIKIVHNKPLFERRYRTSIVHGDGGVDASTMHSVTLPWGDCKLKPGGTFTFNIRQIQAVDPRDPKSHTACAYFDEEEQAWSKRGLFLTSIKLSPIGKDGAIAPVVSCVSTHMTDMQLRGGIGALLPRANRIDITKDYQLLAKYDRADNVWVPAFVLFMCLILGMAIAVGYMIDNKGIGDILSTEEEQYLIHGEIYSENGRANRLRKIKNCFKIFLPCMTKKIHHPYDVEDDNDGEEEPKGCSKEKFRKRIRNWCWCGHGREAVMKKLRKLWEILRTEHLIVGFFAPTRIELCYFTRPQRAACYLTEVLVALAVAGVFFGGDNSNRSHSTQYYTVIGVILSSILMAPITILVPTLFVQAQTHRSFSLDERNERIRSASVAMEEEEEEEEDRFGFATVGFDMLVKRKQAATVKPSDKLAALKQSHDPTFSSASKVEPASQSKALALVQRSKVVPMPRRPSSHAAADLVVEEHDADMQSTDATVSSKVTVDTADLSGHVTLDQTLEAEVTLENDLATADVTTRVHTPWKPLNLRKVRLGKVDLKTSKRSPRVAPAPMAGDESGSSEIESHDEHDRYVIKKVRLEKIELKKKGSRRSLRVAPAANGKHSILSTHNEPDDTTQWEANKDTLTGPKSKKDAHLKKDATSQKPNHSNPKHQIDDFEYEDDATEELPPDLKVLPTATATTEEQGCDRKASQILVQRIAAAQMKHHDELHDIRRDELLAFRALRNLRYFALGLSYCVLALLSAVSTFLVLVYGVKFEHDNQRAWILTSVLAIVVDLMLFQPLRVIIIWLCPNAAVQFVFFLLIMVFLVLAAFCSDAGFDVYVCSALPTGF